MQIDQDVIEVLRRGTWGVYKNPKPTALSFVIGEQLDRKMYERVNKVLSAAGGKWVRGAKAHLFSDDQAATLQAALVAEEITTSSEMGFFPTPARLAHELVYDWAGVEKGEHCLEPSAGTGSIARVLNQAGGLVSCVEIDQTMAGALVHEGIYRTVVNADFLSVHTARVLCNTDGAYDVVVMNPPFSKPNGHDPITHFHIAWALLRPGGRIVCVMPAGVKNNTSKREREFRAWLAGSRDALRRTGEQMRGSIHDLPDGSFSQAGTMVRTVVVVASRGE